MNKTELIQQIFEVCLIPLLGVLTTYLVNYIKAGKEQIQKDIKNEMAEKYTSLLLDIITQCVIATNQTYVDSLKKSGKFDEQAQLEAFNRTKTAVLGILSEEAKKHLNEIYGDLNSFIIQQIEAVVKINK